MEVILPKHSTIHNQSAHVVFHFILHYRYDLERWEVSQAPIVLLKQIEYWLWVHDNEIPIYPISYLHKGDYNPLKKKKKNHVAPV